MTMQSQSNTAAVVVLSGALTIYVAAEKKPMIAQALEQCQRVVLDLAGITEIDGAGIQLLIMAKVEAERSGVRVDFVNHSEAVIEAMELCNLAEFFNDPVVMSRA